MTSWQFTSPHKCINWNEIVSCFVKNPEHMTVKGREASVGSSVTVTDMCFWQLPLPCEACQETHAEGCSAPCDTTCCHRCHRACVQGRKWRRLSSCNFLLYVTHAPDGRVVYWQVWRCSRGGGGGSVVCSNKAIVFTAFTMYIMFSIHFGAERDQRERERVIMRGVFDSLSTPQPAFYPFKVNQWLWLSEKCNYRPLCAAALSVTNPFVCLPPHTYMCERFDLTTLPPHITPLTPNQTLICTLTMVPGLPVKLDTTDCISVSKCLKCSLLSCFWFLLTYRLWPQAVEEAALDVCWTHDIKATPYVI